MINLSLKTIQINVSEIVMLPIFAVVNEVFGRLKTLRLLSVVLVVSTFFLGEI